MNLKKSAVVLVGLGALGVGAFSAIRPTPAVKAAGEPVQAAFVMPALSVDAQEGERYFNAVCAACHGQSALGTDHGPPFINDIYNPGHHGDRAFLMAAQNGVRQHHWPYGNMPPQKVTPAQVARIVVYIRELQEANDITYRPHNM